MDPRAGNSIVPLYGSCPQLPFASLKTDDAIVRELVASLNSEGRTILLVGHSYGGMVISQAGHDAAHLCYLGALLPEPGQTAADVSGICVSETCAKAMVLGPLTDNQVNFSASMPLLVLRPIDH